MNDSSDGLIDILRGAGVIFFGTIVSNGIGLLGEILLARTLLPERFGDIAFAYTIVSILAIIVTFGTAKGIPRLISGDESRDYQQRLFLSAFLITIPAGLVGLIVLIAFSPTIGRIFDVPNIVTVLPLFGFYLLTFSAAQVTAGGLRGLEKAWKTTLARNGGRVIGILLFAFSAWIGVEFIGAVGYYVVTQLAIAIFAAYFVYKQLFANSGSNWAPTKNDIKKTFSFSWPLAISGGFLTLMGNLDVLMISYFLESSQVGYYRSIQPLALLLLTILSSFVFLFMPIATKYYKQDEHEIVEDLFKSTTKFVSIISFPVALVFVLFSSDVVVAFYGNAYEPASYAFSILVIGTYLRVFVGPNAAIIKAIGRTRVDMISAIAGILVNVLLNVTLIPKYGIAGAALATSIGYFTYNVFEIVVIYHSIDSHPFSLNTVKPLIPTMLVAVGIASVTASRSLGLIPLLAIGGILAVIQIISVLGTRSLDPTDAIILQRLEDRFGIDLPFIEWAIQSPIDPTEENSSND